MTYHDLMTNKIVDNHFNFETFNNRIFTVSEFSSSIKKLVETSFNYVQIRGEVFRPSFPGSGHIYFTLKDEVASLSAVV